MEEAKKEKPKAYIKKGYENGLVDTSYVPYEKYVYKPKRKTIIPTNYDSQHRNGIDIKLPEDEYSEDNENEELEDDFEDEVPEDEDED